MFPSTTDMQIVAAWAQDKHLVVLILQSGTIRQSQKRRAQQDGVIKSQTKELMKKTM